MFQPRHHDSYSSSSIHKQRIKCKFPINKDIETQKRKKKTFRKKDTMKENEKEKKKEKANYFIS
jgi:hypothetical protein